MKGIIYSVKCIGQAEDAPVVTRRIVGAASCRVRGNTRRYGTMTKWTKLSVKV
jgi:hypothetical protein